VATTKRNFAHVPCEVGAYEAEEVGVEHLLRDINDPSLSTLAGETRHKLVRAGWGWGAGVRLTLETQPHWTGNAVSMPPPTPQILSTLSLPALPPPDCRRACAGCPRAWARCPRTSPRCGRAGCP
jgi:hypothetical protein